MGLSISDEEAFWSDPDRFGGDDFYGYPPYEAPTVAARIIAAHPNPKRCLDLGCGPGRLTNLIARTDPTLTVMSVDISNQALRHADHSAPPNAGFFKGDGRTIPEGIDDIDLAWSVTVFQHIPLDASVNYIDSVHCRLNDGGVFIFTVARADEPDGPFFHPLPTDPLAFGVCLAPLYDLFDTVKVDHDVVNDWTWLTCSK